MPDHRDTNPEADLAATFGIEYSPEPTAASDYERILREVPALAIATFLAATPAVRAEVLSILGVEGVD